ncbi:MAG: hydrogenase 3 maturation endopeptidase HyCI [Candidatus Bathyarchaeota archaeon]|nr:MAG: hydrogenase 3 maturation endopeptidase HyCI [Candidatus Bathyarchaeota archaeon]
MPELEEWLQGATRVAILGVGSRVKRDDAVGLVVVDHLKGKVPSFVRVFDCETVPESFTGPIRRFSPSHVLIIDAAEMASNIGEIRFLYPDSIAESVFSTHILSLSVLSEYIVSEIGAKVLLLGIQPGDLRFGMELTPELHEVAVKLSHEILSALLKVG